MLSPKLSLSLSFLFLALLLLAPLSAQVGVNEPDPEQALDVNGKIKVGDDVTAPTDGTIRYESSSESFEGYAGGEWQSLNKNAAPTDVEEVVQYAFNLLPAAGPATDDWSADIVNVTPRTGLLTGDAGVPPGRIYVIDHLTVTGRDGQPDEFFYVGIAAGFTSSGTVSNIVNPRIYVSGNTNNGSEELVAARAPLLMVLAGQQLILWNSPTSETSVRVVAHGFYIDADKVDEFYEY